MNSCKEKARAKINLTLDITGTANGYHELDSLVTSLDLYDLVCVTKRKDGAIRLFSKGEGSEAIPESENNAYKAAVLFREEFSCGGAEIKIFKNIPMGAGLGGSSADAAGVLRAMKRLFLSGDDKKDEERVLNIADKTGSDTRAMYLGGFCRMRGRGTRAERIYAGGFCEGDENAAYAGKRAYFLLICPEEGVSSGDCFRLYDKRQMTYPAATERAIACFKAGDSGGLGAAIKNDLTEAACELAPCVKRAIEEAASFSPLGYGMTGSGSAAFALFDSREMLDWAKSRYKGRFRTIAVESEYPLKKPWLFAPVQKGQ